MRIASTLVVVVLLGACTRHETVHTTHHEVVIEKQLSEERRAEIEVPGGYKPMCVADYAVTDVYGWDLRHSVEHFGWDLGIGGTLVLGGIAAFAATGGLASAQQLPYLLGAGAVLIPTGALFIGHGFWKKGHLPGDETRTERVNRRATLTAPAASCGPDVVDVPAGEEVE